MIEPLPEHVDLAVIGGGINGCAIARDAAGRGLSVLLCEQGDLAQATSSASTKLFHGGLRYLEYCEFRLVREALTEREALLRAMPHISWPLRFVLPVEQSLRPAWMLRLGLFLYDHLGGREILPPTRSLDLRRDPAGAPLRTGHRRAFEYSDCRVDDARLVALTARDAAARGAAIRTRTRVERATTEAGCWRIDLAGPEGQATASARVVVNAAGPWVGEVIGVRFGRAAKHAVRLVRGSHIVTRRLFDHDRAYMLQQPDKRIVFAIPYERDFTLIGTTDVEHDGPPDSAVCTGAERDYLLASVNRYFRESVTTADIVWSFAGVRPLYDDGASSATAATRDYVLELDDSTGAPVLDVFGGKITTHRRLAEAAMARLAPYFPAGSGSWTRGAPLPGGDFPWDGAGVLAAELRRAHPFLDQPWADRLVRAYGTEAAPMLAGATTMASLGRHFGATLTEREVRWLWDREWARTAEDVLWRRSKLGLWLTSADAAGLDSWMRATLAGETPTLLAARLGSA